MLVANTFITTIFLKALKPRLVSDYITEVKIDRHRYLVRLMSLYVYAYYKNVDVNIVCV